MADTIEGIPEKKLERLKKHLLKVEGLAGKPLRKTPYTAWTICPITNFAPDYDDRGRNYVGAGLDGYVCYGNAGAEAKSRKVYSLPDSLWWGSLSDKQRRQVTKYIQGWIKDRGGL
ncbi:unnamed protein product [marine sediment metagenome]|uniref:Uncharacterized protein n=1 Tax=marine sediment metagenome TaxID=412755 RepID=X0ZAG8_9ZZZZ